LTTYAETYTIGSSKGTAPKEEIKMTYYVTISDLVMNGGEGCTLLYKRPSADHLVIVENDNDSAHLGSVMISPRDGNALIWRTMRDSIMDPEKGVTVGDMNDARGILFSGRMCSNCKHFEYGRCWKGSDTWANFKAGSCPNKEEMAIYT
jgi:hypothetical protein